MIRLLHHGPQRVDVGRRADLVRYSLRLFWRHIARSAHDHTRLCLLHVAIEFFRKAEVGDLGFAGSGVGISQPNAEGRRAREKKIARCQVAMDDPVLMRRSAPWARLTQ